MLQALARHEFDNRYLNTFSLRFRVHVFSRWSTGNQAVAFQRDP